MHTLVQYISIVLGFIIRLYIQLVTIRSCLLNTCNSSLCARLQTFFSLRETKLKLAICETCTGCIHIQSIFLLSKQIFKRIAYYLCNFFASLHLSNIDQSKEIIKHILLVTKIHSCTVQNVFKFVYESKQNISE